MKNQDNFDALLRDNSLLIAANKELAEMCKEAIFMLKTTYEHREEILVTSLQIFEGLHDKSNRDVIEQSWYHALRKAIMRQNIQ